MTRAARLITTCGLAAWLLVPVEAQQSPRPTRTDAAGLSRAALEQATSLLKAEVGAPHIAGAVAAVLRHGRLVYLQTIGVQDLATGAPMTERSMFRIYSMTKPITAVAVMMLLEERRFELDDPVARYLAEFSGIMVMDPGGAALRPPARAITVRDLLLHTSGLNHRTSDIYRREQVRTRTMPMSQFLANLVRVGLMEDPGTRWRYSESTTVLGRLVEIWSGKPFDVFLEERVFRPLKMHDTMFWAATADARARLTTVYGPATAGNGLSEVQTETLPFTERPALIEGAVGLLSTVPDYLRFCQMLLNRGALEGVQLLRPQTVDLMTTNGLSADLQRARGGSMGWGLGNVDVALQRTPTSDVGEYGWDGTAGTIFWINPSKQLITILMTPSSPANPGQIRQRFKTLVQQAIVD
jgi:CubicO group peptidase (beta-lactamase class C family)